LLSNFISLTR